jgi:CO/xanthine dehydrogenase FAD-binding subunit
MKHFMRSRVIPILEYHRPKELQAALTLIHELRDNSRIIAGGTDIIPTIHKGTLSSLSLHMVDISSIKELDYIRKEKDYIRIGAVTTLSDLEDSEIIKKNVPILADAVGHIGSLQIRTRGTLGGNLCNASPAADTAPPLLTLGARVILRGMDRQRIVPLDQFFLEPGKNILAPTEILTEIQIPILDEHGSFNFQKLGRRNAFTLSIVSVAIWLKVEKGTFQEIRIALGAVAPTPMRALKAEEYFRGKRVTEKNIDNGAKVVIDEIQPVSDVRASADYRKDMSYILTRRAILSCLSLSN